MPKTIEEIEALKENWIKDPCWDIETTEGFEDHVEELLNFRRQTEAEWDANHAAREATRHQLVMEQTGVTDSDITSALSTFNEIERMVSSQDRYIGEISTHEAIVTAELQMAQIRATLLQAAQLKRIADVLESMDVETFDPVRIWGTGK